METSKTYDSDKHIGQKWINALLRLLISIAIVGGIATIGVFAFFVSNLLYITSVHQPLPNVDKKDLNRPAELSSKQAPHAITSKNRVPKELSVTHEKTAKPFHGMNIKPSVDVPEENSRYADSDDENKNVHKRLEEREIQLLRDALPGNMMLPGIRTATELNNAVEDIKEQQHLQTLIESGKATANDLRRYYDLRAKHFEDELSLIEYCDKVLSTADSEEDLPYSFCMEISVNSAEVRRANEASLAKLRQDFL